MGAGVSLAVKGPDGKALFPSWGEIFERAAKRVSNVKQAQMIRLHAEEGEYLEAARRAQQELKGDWIRFLKDTFQPEEPARPIAGLELANAIWKLGSKLIITTNYDRVLQWSCPKMPTVLGPWSKAGFGDLCPGRCDHETVWHLHGHIDTPDQLILTLDSYERLYKGNEYEAATSTLREHLKAQTFLFIGFGMEEALRQPIAWVKDTFAGAGGNHFGLVREPQVKEFGLNL